MHTMVCSRQAAPALVECGCLLGVNIQQHFCQVLSESAADAPIIGEREPGRMCTECCQWAMSKRKRRKKKRQTNWDSWGKCQGSHHPYQWDSCSLRCSPLLELVAYLFKELNLRSWWKVKLAPKKWVKEGYFLGINLFFVPASLL